MAVAYVMGEWLYFVWNVIGLQAIFTPVCFLDIIRSLVLGAVSKLIGKLNGDRGPLWGYKGGYLRER
jgi:hypothetical protein